VNQSRVALRNDAMHFAGAVFNPVDRTVRIDGQTICLTPREARLIEFLAESPGTVVTYETLYIEILGRTFGGDTSNMRVLLGKLAGSLKQVGISVRACVDVIPKAGYRYRPTVSTA
jgi:DNA-binding winged helix-turn-helix (wHTH) protein